MSSRSAHMPKIGKSRTDLGRLEGTFVGKVPRFPDLTTDVFNDDAISFLLADLNRKGSAVGLDEHLLGRAATERFVTERLLPLLPDAKPPLSPNLRRILRQAGSRHGRRYTSI